MKLTIIETGLVPEPIRASFVDYPGMFRALIRASDPSISFETVSVIKGESLPNPARLEAILITGSPAGVYDDEPWMAPLMDFIRAAATAEVPQVGICFGHQAIAEALGGKVIKSPKGWGVGRHTYDVEACPGLVAKNCPKTISVAVSHQDQVVTLPPGAEVIARSDFTPHAGLHYAQAPALSFQCHPEFDDTYSAALYTARKERLGAAAEAAVSSLATPNDNDVLGSWITGFLKALQR
ncbi:type 1 glutamine amidotransferase [Hyphomonas oceanitis]|uniref:Class I glutamine amidotransferase domain-containing protein n=1 Tax=Hyphomonas oceanitis SCH89 TaxID=1280953 RepID=A0A059G9C4_9PROT|nr:type 1 glutamine amidotransferase [Hyphomonas oceanitis]KDA03432.1 class I glutamine amidotransferase domain-containing protein [Hyphomonas oceanitis SCH89]